MSNTTSIPVSSGQNKSLAGGSGLLLAVLGVVFGDIGTSPLYALRECFTGLHSIPATSENVFGAVSLIFWFLVIIVSFKYVILMMRADNKGEGGILALMALVHRIGPKKIRNMRLIVLFGILGAALLFSDGVITPTISVLSAVEGLQVATPIFNPFIIPISLAILTGLFLIQSHGTQKIGILFGPILLIWFITIGTLGLISIIHNHTILLALNPVYAVNLLIANGWKGFSLLGTAFLAVTGAEVMYADMGHFGKKPIRTTWFYVVFPALLLNYMGQGAHLLRNGQAANLFYQLSPPWFVIPLVVIATLATTIASQAVISGAFSLARQAVQLGFWPRIRVIHTSHSHIGQVYVPFINFSLFVVTVFLILMFKKSGNLASAYGIAVSATMLITTILVLMLARTLWRVSLFMILLVGTLLLGLQTLLFGANLIKLQSGGWVVVVIAALVYVCITTWLAGRKILQQRIQKESIPIEKFIQEIAGQNLTRSSKTGVFLSGNTASVPRALLHNINHNGVLHDKTLIVSVLTEEKPSIKASNRFTVTSLGLGIYQIVLRCGFMESPDVPKALAALEITGVSQNNEQLSYFLGKESLVIAHSHAMFIWRKQLFVFLARNALDASSFFKLPPNRVVELGVQIEF